RVNLSRFLPCLIVLAAVSFGITTACQGMLVGGIYIPMMSVFLCLIPASGLVRKVVEYADCRNRFLAGMVGAACALVGYLGAFHLDQCMRWHVPWSAVDRVPEYVAFRMATDTWDASGRAVVVRPLQPAAGVRPAAPLANADFLSWHWALFFLEAL